MAVATPDKTAAELFSERTLQIINDGALALMMSIGHRTGLFDTMAHLPPAPAATIAKAAQLNERYVREWLGAMVTGGIVDYDATARTYRLPEAHAASLTREMSPNNMAVTTQWIGVLGGVEDAVVDAFHHGEGVPYGAYHRFHSVMAEESQQTVVAGLREHILPLVDGLTARLTSGIDVLDVACGSGRAVLAMAEAFPASRFTGIDMSAEAIAAGRGEVTTRRVRNATLVVGDAAALDMRPRYDLVTAFDAIHDQAQPDEVLQRIQRALRPGGVFLMQDIAGRTELADNMTNPLAPFTYTISCMHCMSVSLSSGGPGLGAMWGREKALEMLAAAGFTGVRVDTLPHDPINYYYVAAKKS
ncbi:MAG TPA: class I SAM-dependent methyltransferase [Vicinamibacterales bacterium]|nr:class I SAM-dependent methyltransferase [Vicinamibacterales bacterium]